MIILHLHWSTVSACCLLSFISYQQVEWTIAHYNIFLSCFQSLSWFVFIRCYNFYSIGFVFQCIKMDFVASLIWVIKQKSNRFGFQMKTQILRFSNNDCTFSAIWTFFWSIGHFLRVESWQVCSMLAYIVQCTRMF